MNHRSTPPDEFEDDDLHALFNKQSKAQSGKPPAELDELILKAAGNAVGSGTEKGADVNSGTDADVRVISPAITSKSFSTASSSTAITSLEQHRQRKATVSRRITSWFAVAATVVVGISVAPVLLKTPETSLQPDYSFDSEQSSLEDLQAAESVAVSVSRSPAATQSSEAAPAAGADMSVATTALQQELSLVDRSGKSISITVQPGTVIKAANSRQTADGVAERTADDELTYRRSVENWIKEIRKLLDDNKIEAAREEYAIFRLRYAAKPVDARLDQPELTDQ